MKKTILLGLMFFVFMLGFNYANDRDPIAVSPGEKTGMAIVEQRCPTFSWTAVSWAVGYRIAVFKADSSGPGLSYAEQKIQEEPVLIKDIKGSALAWTPPAKNRLTNGQEYVWFVQAVDVNGSGVWSEGNRFKVVTELSFASVEDKLKKKLEDSGVNSESIANAFKEVKSTQEIVIPKREKRTNDHNQGISRPLASENDGNQNVYYGAGAGSSLTSGTYNSMFGYYAGTLTTIGSLNAFFGTGAGRSNITGEGNTFIGTDAGWNNTVSGNTFVGFYAGRANTTGYSNTFTGYRAGYSNTTGRYNTFSGAWAGCSNTIGLLNTFTGRSAGFSNTSGYNNTFTGYEAGYLNTTGHSNTFSGVQAGISNTTGYGNTFSGYQAGWSNTTGGANTFSGLGAGKNNTTGASNTFSGAGAGEFNTTGYSNTSFGRRAGYSNSTGTRNLFLGYYAGFSETGSNKLYIDNSSTASPLIYGEFDNNTLCINGKLGVGGSNYTPTYEVDVDGYVRTKYFMQQSVAPQMRWYETDGADPGDFFKMNYHANSLEFIWYDDSAATTYVPIKMKGNGYVGINNQNPTHMLDVGTSGAYCNGGAWVNGSSLAYKENIQTLELTEAQDVLAKLAPVKYNYKEDKEEQYLGFIAEDVPELVAMQDRKGLHTMDVVTVLTKVVQDQQKKLKTQNTILTDQQHEIKTLKEQQKEKDKRNNQLLKTQNEQIKKQQKQYNELLKRIGRLEKK